MSEDITNIDQHVDESFAGHAEEAQPVHEEIIIEAEIETPVVAIPAVAVETPVPSAPKAAVSGADTDEVYLANCVYKNTAARKSLTVHHLQRRLAELGYNEAMTDKDGWLGDETKVAIEKFQKLEGLEPNGIVDEATFLAIFKGDMNVVPIV
jgi:peptidoglycan hydrolase-like protein with peptidoglycan-binding domain